MKNIKQFIVNHYGICFWGLIAISLIIFAILLSGCKGGVDGCDDDPSSPAGYQQIDKYKNGDYEQRTYYKQGHYITWTTADGCEWDKSDYYSYD